MIIMMDLTVVVLVVDMEAELAHLLEALDMEVVEVEVEVLDMQV